MNKSVLIVEDVFVVANNIRIILKKAGFRVTAIAKSYEQAVESVEKERPDLVLLDIFLAGDKTGIDLAKWLKVRDIAFVYLSANSNKTTQDLANETEPYGFLVKPFRERDVLVTLDIALYLHTQKSTLLDREHRLAESPRPVAFPGIIGQSASLKKVLHMVEVVAATDTSVLLLGESGTGKEGIAAAIHQNSTRKGKPMINVNCAALPASVIESELFGHERGAFTGAYEQRIGKFEQAHGGTIFLDEIGEMPMDMQVKLLRVLQEKEIDRIGGKRSFRVDIRIIAATNLKLENEVMEGRFRMDLYYRLNVFPIQLPPLRDREEDIGLLAEYFVQHFCALHGMPKKELSPKAAAALSAYPWPGNVRELQHLMERTVLLTPEDTIAQVALPVLDTFKLPGNKGPRVKTIQEMETEHIRSVLQMCNGKVSGPGGAAEMLKLPYSTLIAKIRKLGIRTEKYFH